MEKTTKQHTESLRCKDGYAVRAILPRPEGRRLVALFGQLLCVVSV